jgi:hypothetical protein
VKAASGLRAVSILRELERRHPSLDPGVRRTLKRRIRAEQDLFSQSLRTWADEVVRLTETSDLDAPTVTVAGQRLDYSFYHFFCLAYSGFEHVQVS